MLNLEMYTQMGYREAEVREAHLFHKKTGIEMFEALHQLQHRDQSKKEANQNKAIPNHSFLTKIEHIQLSEFDLIFCPQTVSHHPISSELREPNTPVGLLNVSNCCYLNSLLQCYFLMGEFTKEILSAEEMNELPDYSSVKNKRIRNEYLLLGAFKEIFAKMKLSSKKYLDPTPVLKNLVNSVGEKIEYGDEKDLNEINMEIVDRVSECLAYTNKYNSMCPLKSKAKEDIKKLFYGQKVEFVDGLENNEKVVMEFMGIILNIKYGSVMAALDAEFCYDVEIKNKSHKKYIFIRSLPKYLFLTINRTEFATKQNQTVKNSSKIQFDFTIDLEKYFDKSSSCKEDKQTGKLFLMFIFAHRGSALSGHYWGYGKNGKDWYKFDINSTKVKQDYLLVDMEKCNGVPYAFVYAKEEVLESFAYPYHMKHNIECNLLDEDHNSDYITFIPQALRKQIIDQNISMQCKTQSEIQSNRMEPNQKRFRNLAAAIAKDYVSKLTIAKELARRFEKIESNSKICCYSSFGCYLEFVKEEKMMKHHILSLALSKAQVESSLSEISFREFLSNQNLMQHVQYELKQKNMENLFPSKIEENMLWSRAYLIHAEEYVIGKKCLAFIQLMKLGMDKWPELGNLSTLLDEMVVILREKPEVYLKNVVRELITVGLLDLAYKRQPIDQNWIEVCCPKNPLLRQQLQEMNMKSKQAVEGNKKNKISEIKLETEWSINNLLIGFEKEVVEAIKIIVERLKDGMQIYRANAKENKIVTNPQTSTTSTSGKYESLI